MWSSGPSHWPAVAAAAVAWDAWLDLNLYTRQPWLGLIMAAAILRARGLTSHLLPLAAGFKQSKFRPQGREGALEKLEGFCQVIEEALSHRQQGSRAADPRPRADEPGDRQDAAATRSCRSWSSCSCRGRW